MEKVASKDGISVYLRGLKGQAKARELVLVHEATGNSATFRVGHQAVYGGFNFLYYGTITSIAAGTVTLRGNARGHRLKHENFAFWNRKAARGERDSSFSDWLSNH